MKLYEFLNGIEPKQIISIVKDDTELYHGHCDVVVWDKKELHQFEVKSVFSQGRVVTIRCGE